MRGEIFAKRRLYSVKMYYTIALTRCLKLLYDSHAQLLSGSVPKLPSDSVKMHYTSALTRCLKVLHVSHAQLLSGSVPKLPSSPS